MISTLDACTAATVRSWARKASRRCTSVTEAATGSRCCAQSKALSPPPTMTTSLPAYGAKLGTKNSMPRPTQPSPAGSGRGLNLPMPEVMSTAPAVTVGAVVEGDDDVVVAVLERRGGAVEEVRRVGRGRLRDQPLHQVAALDAGEAGDVEDRLLGVHRGDLAAELGQRVDHRRRSGRGSPRSRRRTGPVGPAPMISRSVVTSSTWRSFRSGRRGRKPQPGRRARRPSTRRPTRSSVTSTRSRSRRGSRRSSAGGALVDEDQHPGVRRRWRSPGRSRPPRRTPRCGRGVLEVATPAIVRS